MATERTDQSPLFSPHSLLGMPSQIAFCPSRDISFHHLRDERVHGMAARACHAWQSLTSDFTEFRIPVLLRKSPASEPLFLLLGFASPLRAPRGSSSIDSLDHAQRSNGEDALPCSLFPLGDCQHDKGHEEPRRGSSPLESRPRPMARRQPDAIFRSWFQA